MEVSNTHLTKSSVRINRGVESLFGTRDENIRLLESGLGVHTQLVDNSLEIEGEAPNVSRAENILEDYNTLVREGHVFNNGDLNSYLRVVTIDPEVSLRALVHSGKQRNFGKKMLAPKSVNQRRYLEAIERNDLVIGIGPAGTGKTYLAVAMAVSALINKQVSRIILTRPAVEAGERLGFLPGTLQEKVDPYLRPLYDALYDMIESDRVEKLLERNAIEVAPIAFMRGRTLNDSFIILDEAQNSTPEQMKMVLTRLGSNSKMVVNGDITQIDLRDIAVHNHLGVAAEAREHHLHLFRRAVLRLVQNDETVIERAAAHEGDGSHFDCIPLQQFLHAVAFDHVVERVIQRAQVGVDFLLQGPWQKAQTLAGFHGGARQDDARDLLVDQRGDGHGNGQIRLAGAGGADADHQVIALDGLQIAPLVDGFRRQHFLAEVALLAAMHQRPQRHLRIDRDHAQVAVEIAVVEDVALADQRVVVFQDILGPGDVGRFAFDFQAVVDQLSVDAQSGL